MLEIAKYGILIILSTSLIMHICIVLKWIPYHMIWGGRLKTDREMYSFEAVSITTTCIFILLTLMVLGLLPSIFPKMVMTVFPWVMAIVFFVNTIGNIMSKNQFEKLVFTPITAILSVFSIILALFN